MASADYKLCQVCGGKTFYDSDIHYDYERGEYEGCGECRALCLECSKEWQLMTIRKPEECRK